MADGPKFSKQEEALLEEPPSTPESLSTKGVTKFTDPLSNQIADWCLTAEKMVKAIRVYDSNNQTLIKFLDRAEQQLTSIHSSVEDFSLYIREDRFCYGEDIVYQNADRQYGLPFLLYRNAIRRITFTKGFTREEIVALFKALTTDFNTFDYAGEDLVTILWRLQLQHLKYFAVEALSISSNSTTDLDPSEIRDVEEIQHDVDSLVGAIYATASDDDDVVESITITKEDLEALKEIRDESEEDLEVLDAATARALTAIPQSAIDKIQAEQQGDSHDRLMSRLIDILTDLLFQERGGKNFAASMDLIQQLMDALLFSAHYDRAVFIVENLRKKADRSEDLTAMHVSRHMQKSLSIASSISPLVAMMDQESDLKAIEEITNYLDCLGEHVSGTLITLLNTVTAKEIRLKIVGLITANPISDFSLLESEMEKSKPVVMLDFLDIGKKLSTKNLAPLILIALEKEYPPLRIKALELLLKFPKGVADELLTSAFSHKELEVRIKAYQIAASRKSTAARSTLRLSLLSENIWEMKLREVRTMTAAYAAIAEADAVLVLSKILQPGLFSKKNIDTQIAAAFALAQVNNDASKQHLEKASRSMSTKLRDACKRALQDGAGAANIASFLSEDLIISGFVKINSSKGDILKTALDDRRRRRNLATEENENTDPLDTRSEDELFANVLKPHNEPDFVPENLMSAPTEKVQTGGSPDTPKTAPSTSSLLKNPSKKEPKDQENSEPLFDPMPSLPEQVTTENLRTALPKIPAEISVPSVNSSGQAQSTLPAPRDDLKEDLSLKTEQIVPAAPMTPVLPSLTNTNPPHANLPLPPDHPQQLPPAGKPPAHAQATLHSGPSSRPSQIRPPTASAPLRPHTQSPTGAPPSNEIFQSQVPRPQAPPLPVSQNSHPWPHPQSQVPHPQAQVPHPQAQIPYPQSQVPHPQSQVPHPQSQVPYPQAQVPHPQSQVPYPQAQVPHPQGQIPRYPAPPPPQYPNPAMANFTPPGVQNIVPPQAQRPADSLPSGREPPKRTLSADFAKKLKVAESGKKPPRTNPTFGREYEKKGGDT